jgi:uncharacterized protein YqjF (DUF2071 family)
LHLLLKVADHRPWLVPPGPWIMRQTWNDLLFAHWPVPAETLRPLVPSYLQLDTFEGRCWLAVTPFHMTGVRLRAAPAIPGMLAFPEMNVRTCVSFGGKPGIFFFSLDAGSSLASWAARLTYRLPYFHAKMTVRNENGWINYESHRPHNAHFRAKYRPVSDVRIRDKGTLEHWLTERYCLYTIVGTRVFRCEIHHVPWPLQDAEAQIAENTMAAAAGITLPQVRPLLHYAKKLDVLIWPLKKS